MYGTLIYREYLIYYYNLEISSLLYVNHLQFKEHIKVNKKKIKITLF